MQFEDKKIKNGILWILILLSVVAAVNQLLIGFDIDEGYAVSMPFRLLQGDHLFADMWEVHQTSALLPAAFLSGDRIDRLYGALSAHCCDTATSWHDSAYLQKDKKISDSGLEPFICTFVSEPLTEVDHIAGFFHAAGMGTYLIVYMLTGRKRNGEKTALAGFSGGTFPGIYSACLSGHGAVISGGFSDDLYV